MEKVIMIMKKNFVALIIGFAVPQISMADSKFGCLFGVHYAGRYKPVWEKVEERIASTNVIEGTITHEKGGITHYQVDKDPFSITIRLESEDRSQHVVFWANPTQERNMNQYASFEFKSSSGWATAYCWGK